MLLYRSVISKNEKAVTVCLLFVENIFSLVSCGTLLLEDIFKSSD